MGSDFSDSEKSDFNPSKYRTMDELKEALGDVNLNVETDIEIITKLVSQFKEATEKDKETILDDLEYYVHQYDNALLFVDLGGLQNTIIPSLNSSSTSLRRLSCLLLSGASQSNPKFQIAAFEHGLVETLLRMTVLDQDPEVSTKSFSAMSAVIRNFPEAQNSLLRQGGLGVLIKIFDHEHNVYEKLKIKVLTMINDLLIERDDAAKMNDEASVKRRSQYNDIDKKFSIEAQILAHGWCQVFSKILILPERDDSTAVGEEVPLKIEHDIIEKLIGAMETILSKCSHPEYSQQDNLHYKLTLLHSHYQTLSDREKEEVDSDLYFSGILTSIERVLHLFVRSDLHTEL